jgi:type VI secretion system protein ImpA
MASGTDVLEFEQLLRPLSEGGPCGESLRWDPVWSELAELRKTRKDPLDPSADKTPDWVAVETLATELLAERTKDLMIAGWLTESALRRHGFAGFRDGLKLIRGLMESYWDDLHPLPDEGDYSVRAAPLAWLTTADGGARMPVLFRDVPLAQGKEDEPLNWTFWNRRRAAPKGRDEDESAYEKRVADAERNKQIFDAAVEATPLEFYKSLREDIAASLEEIDKVAGLADERLGDNAPGWGDLRKAISEIEVFVIDVLKRRGGLVGESTDDQTETGGTAVQSNGAAFGSGPIRSRAEAVARLEEIAGYFTSLDPQSPVAYLIRRAVRWAGMSLEELLTELVKDDSTFNHIGETLGLPPRS